MLNVHNGIYVVQDRQSKGLVNCIDVIQL